MAKMCAVVAMAFALFVGQAEAQGVARIEVHPIQTVTLKTAQILTGDTKGAAVTVAGELRIPKPGTDRLPAVILVHGSGGVSGSVDAWAKEINSLGVASSFSIHLPDAASSTPAMTNRNLIRWQ
jgi:acetyl esterase/lipase